MIQAPQVQYMPIQQPALGTQQTGVANTVQTMQPAMTPGVFYNYPTASSYLPSNSFATDRAQYNGVNIEVINPQGQGISPQVPAQYYPVQQPVYIPQYQTVPAAQPMPAAAVYNAPVSNAQIQPQYQPVQPAAQQVPEPQIQTENAQAPAAAETVQPAATQAAAPVVSEPVPANPSVSPETFAGRLKTDDLDSQEKTLEEIAELVKNDETAGPVLLDTQVFDALVEVLNKDTSSLQGPTPEIMELRNKPEKDRTAEENEKANTATPLEKAEANKQYALYTMAYMQERLNNELEKRGSKALALNELPCIENVIDAAKSNQDPMVRVGAIASLSRIARPEYKSDLTTIFNLAKSDEDSKVKEAADKALKSLDNLK